MNPDFVYSSDCYLKKRGSIRRGFGGNYRRASDSSAVSWSSASSVENSDQRPLHSDLIPFSLCRKNRPSSSCLLETNSENLPLCNNMQPSDHFWEQTLAAYAERKNEDSVTLHKLNPLAGGQSCREGKESERRISFTGNRELLPLLVEDEMSNVSVMECIKSFEQTDQQTTTAAEDKPKVITKTRVAELRETILRRSSENLADTTSYSNPSRINKRPVSAVLECSFGTFPKIPISTIQRRSIGTLFQAPLVDIQQCSVTDILKLSADKQESYVDRNQREDNSVPLRSIICDNSKEQKHQTCLRKSNFVPSDKTIDETNSSFHRRSGAETLSGCLIKTDSLDSGIDTKMDCFGNRSTTEVSESFPDGSCQSSASVERVNTSCSISTYFNVNGNQSKSVQQAKERGNIHEIVKPTSTAPPSVCLNLESDEFAQISSEETDYNKLVVQVLRKLKEEKTDLHFVLLPSTSYKTSFYYMVDAVKSVKIPEFWVNLPMASIDTELQSSERSSDEDMVHLLNCVKHKIEVKKLNREDIECKISERKDLESQVSNVIKFRVEKKKYDKYCLYLDELDKVLHLMFMLASRLASTENTLALLHTEEDAMLVKDVP